MSPVRGRGFAANALVIIKRWANCRPATFRTILRRLTTDLSRISSRHGAKKVAVFYEWHFSVCPAVGMNVLRDLVGSVARLLRGNEGIFEDSLS